MSSVSESHMSRMSRMSCTSRSSGRPARRGLVLLAVGAVLLSACGSGDKSSGSSSGSSDAASTTAAVVAGAQENAVAAGEACHDWPAGTTVVPCAVGVMGPGGGRVFYDAAANLGKAQDWGRFLEVAPQVWNGPLFECADNVYGNKCGADAGVEAKSSDQGLVWSKALGRFFPADGFSFCALDSAAMSKSTFGPPADSGDARVGGGRKNTELLLGFGACTTGLVDDAAYASECGTAADGSIQRCITKQSSALTAAASYRGGGLSDWYLPSQDELVELCRYQGRNGIGGFWDKREYASSTTSNKLGVEGVAASVAVVTMDSGCSVVWRYVFRALPHTGDLNYHPQLVRPVRAFTGPLVATQTVCHDWPAGTTVVPCSVGVKGPGGGRVFYDAGSVQSWGRFLEVAPQVWNPELNGELFACSRIGISGCDAADGAVKNQSGDKGGLDTLDYGGYLPCARYQTGTLLAGEAGDTAWAIGAGRRNSLVLSQAAGCDSEYSALAIALRYQGGGLDDWYLPSGGELTELCRYTGRNSIGGFFADSYVSSTVGPKDGITNFFGVNFGDAPTCTRDDKVFDISVYGRRAVRPIRAFA